MFGTLHWNSQTKEAEFIERPHGSSNLEVNSACDRCRAKKVKCNSSNKSNDSITDCTRCKRLGKTCTFSPLKNRGDGAKKTSIPAVRHEHYVKLVSNVSTGIGNLRSSDYRPNKRRLTSSESTPSPTVGDLLCQENSRERSSSSASESSRTDRIVLSDSSGFNLTFPTDSFAHADTHEPKDILDLDMLSLPSFSPTHLPDSMSFPSPTAISLSSNKNAVFTTTQDTVIESHAILSDENVGYFPSAEDHFQESMFPEFAPGMTPRGSMESTIGGPNHTQIFSNWACHCLAAIVFAVEELEGRCANGNRASLDNILAYHKRAVKNCRHMLECNHCRSRRENLVLLAFMSEKIVAACGAVVSLYIAKDDKSRANPSLTCSLLNSPYQGDVERQAGDIADWELSTSTSSASSMVDLACAGRVKGSDTTSTSADWQELLLGDYKISSSTEWEHLVRVLICLQLQAVVELLEAVNTIGSEVLGDTQSCRVVLYQRRVQELLKDVHRL